MRLCGLAVTGSERSPLRPEVSTAEESGLEDCGARYRLGILAPGGSTPETFAATVKHDRESWRDVIRKPNIRLN